jgi:hypothetical protein
MNFCEDCRQRKNWPNSAIVEINRCEACGNTVECYDVPSVRLILERDRTFEQKLIFKMMQEGFRGKAELIVITNRDGKVDHVKTEIVREQVVKRNGEIDWFDTYNLRLALQKGIQMDEESKRNRRS